ncbi:ABC transporter permease [Nonomuraea basaltis]|uniref:ABC transporter permease n=1 Tax=Nonomuraea basaltis TaxID=2495887 RepID=UPI0019813CCE|nr:FtsX-like permease family protein [Nonomuraea basaltis]
MYLRMVARSLGRRRSRVIVALLSVAVGATTLAGLITVCLDIPRQLEREFRSYGANLVILPAGEAAALSPSVLDAAADVLRQGDVVGVAPYRYETVKINEQPFTVAGTDLAGAKAVSPYWYVDGTWPQAPRELLIGRDVAEFLDRKVGETATLVGADEKDRDVTETFTIAGILETGGAEDGFVFMADDDLHKLVGGGERFDVVEYSIAASREFLDAAATRITYTIDGASAAPVKRVTESEGNVLSTLTSLVFLVTVIVLALTMVSVSTTMTAVVTERRREIGLKKALGAENSGIVREFLGEGILIGAAGGLVGALLGFGLAEMFSMNVFHRGISFRPSLVPFTVLISVVCTAVACLIPVRRAIDVDPAIVLRGE